MKISIVVPWSNFPFVYDDETRTATDPITKEEVAVSVDPIIEKTIKNNREYIIRFDRFTRRPLLAYTETKPYDPKKFKSEQEYQDFLSGE